MENKNFTAVEWLVLQVNSDCLNSAFIRPELVDQAIEMEKEQRGKTIELPSDEEIDKVAKDKIGLSNDCFGEYDFTVGKQDGFYEGAIWMRDKILNK